MKGLHKIPDEGALEQAYRHLQAGEPLSVSDYVIYSQWARFDPRLAEQLVAALAHDWKKTPPVLLNEELKRQPWSAAFGVLLEFVALKAKSLSLRTGFPSPRLFSRWRDCAMSGIAPAPNEAFFIGTRAFGGALAFEDAAAATKPYRKWGYFGRDSLLGKSPEKSTLASRAARLAAIDALLHEKKRFTVSDYIARLGNSVHRRQAQRDLESHPGVLRVGRTRGRFYVSAAYLRRSSRKHRSANSRATKLIFRSGEEDFFERGD